MTFRPHKLREPARPTGTPQTAPTATPPTAQAVGAPLPQTSNGAIGTGSTDAPNAQVMGDHARSTAGRKHNALPGETAGRALPSGLRPAELFTHQIKGRDMAAYAHHAAPTLMEAQRALRDALDRHDHVRAHAYVKYTRALVRRAQERADDDLYGGAV